MEIELYPPLCLSDCEKVGTADKVRNTAKNIKVMRPKGDKKAGDDSGEIRIMILWASFGHKGFDKFV
jgi:hypothetical protein